MGRKKVGIITFHASHNYGSMLQTYALQQTILGMGCDCEVINFRLPRQKDAFLPPFRRGTLLGKIKRTLQFLPYIQGLNKKYELFEDFIKNNLLLSAEEYSSLQELERADLHYDVYVSGSDQIWNPYCLDFDFAYFLPFVKSGRKVSYAPSLGPKPTCSIWGRDENTVRSFLERYDSLSVRDNKAQQAVQMLTGKQCSVVSDPTLLFEPKKWDELAGNSPIIEGDYIFLYTPWYNEKVFSVAEQFSDKLRLPVVVSQLYADMGNNKWLKKKNFHTHLDTGPIEFLNLCKYAKCVIGGSFHVVVFSILLRTPFYAVGGMSDSRVSEILLLTGLKKRSLDDDIDWDNVSLDVDFVEAEDKINEERGRNLDWIRANIVDPNI